MTDDRSSFPLSQSLKSLKKKSTNLKMHRSINAATGINVHTKRTSSSLSISLVSNIFSDFCELPLCCLFSPLCISYPPSSCFFFSFIFSSPSTFSLSCWRVGPRRLVHTHKDTTRTKQRTQRYAESFLQVEPRCIIATLKTSCRFSMSLIDVHKSDGLRCSRNMCVCVLVITIPGECKWTPTGWRLLSVSDNFSVVGRFCATQRWSAAIVYASPREISMFTGSLWSMACF